MIRPVRDDERAELAVAVSRTWGSSRIVSRGVVYEITDLPCLLAVDGERWLGVAAYRPAGGECELVLLEAFERGAGVGTALARRRRRTGTQFEQPAPLARHYE
jgi:hypothetical protein